MCTVCQIHHGTGPSPTASRRQMSQVDATDESPPSVQVVPYHDPVWTPTHVTAVKKQGRNLVSTITSWTQSRHEVSRSYALGFRADPRCVPVIDLVEDGFERAGADITRRLAMALKPLQAAVGGLARNVKSAPKKRADPIKAAVTPIKAAKGRITGKSKPKATNNTKTKSPTHLFKGSKTKVLKMTRKCFMSRAFKAEDRQASGEGCTLGVIKERRGEAFRDAGLQWDIQWGV